MTKWDNMGKAFSLKRKALGKEDFAGAKSNAF